MGPINSASTMRNGGLATLYTGDDILNGSQEIGSSSPYKRNGGEMP